MSWFDRRKGDGAAAGESYLTQLLRILAPAAMRPVPPPPSTVRARIAPVEHELLRRPPADPGPSSWSTAIGGAASPSAPWRRRSGATAVALAVTPRPLPRMREALSIADFAVGDLIAETYMVVRVIARGRKHSVYVAHHVPWDTDVVVKAPRDELLGDREALQALVTDAARWTSLGLHPHIAYAHQLHYLDDVPLLVIEHVDAGNLRPWIANARTANLRIGLNLAIQICHGLEHAHGQGVWHGAVTPENVLVTAAGIVRVSDVGIGSVVQRDGEVAAGKRVADAFVAPEQWVEAREASVASDVFALGVCLYEMFCGGRPYDVARGPRRNPPEPRAPQADRPMPERLGALLKRCVDWDPDQRPGAVAEIRRELCATHVELFRRPSPFAELPPPTWEADGWNNQAVAAHLLGNSAVADAAWDSALAADPAHIEATYNFGLIRWRRGELSDEALIQQLAALRGLAGSPANATYFLALVHLERGDLAAALPLLEEAVARRGTAELRAALAAAQEIGPRRAARMVAEHPQYVSAVALSADGRWLVAGCDDRTLSVWDAHKGRRVRTLDGHAQRVSSVALTGDGKLALSGGDDFAVRLWDVPTGRCLRKIDLAGKVLAVALNADGSRGLSLCIGTDGSVGIEGTVLQVWELSTGRCLRIFEGDSGGAKTVALSGDGRRAFSAGEDHAVRVWDVASGACAHVLDGHTHYVSCLAARSDGTQLLSGSWDRTLRLWDVVKMRCLRAFSGHVGIVTCAALSADGTLAVSGGLDRTVRIWETATGRCLRTFEEHGSMVTGVALSVDGRTAVSGSWDATVRVWEVPSAAAQLGTLQLSERVPYAQMPPAEPDAEELLAAAEQAAQAQRWGAALERLQRVRALGHDDERSRQLWRLLARVCARGPLRAVRPTSNFVTNDHVEAVRLTEDGRWVVTAGRDGRVRVWDTDLRLCARVFEGHADRVLDIALSGDEALLVSASADRTLRVWEVASGHCTRTLDGHRSVVTAVRISDDQRWVLSGSFDHTVRVWDVASGTCIRVLTGHTRQVTAVALSRDGQMAASGGCDQTVRLWDTTTGTCTRTLEGHTRPLTALVASRDWRRLVSAAADGTLRVWDIATGDCLRVFEGHGAAVDALEISADGVWAISASRDGRVRLWALENGQCVGTIHQTVAGKAGVALSSDHLRLVSTTADKRLQLFELEWELQA